MGAYVVKGKAGLGFILVGSVKLRWYLCPFFYKCGCTFALAVRFHFIEWILIPGSSINFVSNERTER